MYASIPNLALTHLLLRKTRSKPRCVHFLALANHPLRTNILPLELSGQSRLSEFGSAAKSALTTTDSGLADALHCN